MINDPGKITSQVQRLAHNALALAAGGIVAQLAFIFVEILVARKLGAEVYGVFVTAYACTVLASFLMELGTPLWAIQEGSRDHERISVLLGSGLVVNVATFAVLYLLLAVVANTLESGPIQGFLLIFLPYGLILAVQSQLASVYSSFQTMHINALFQGAAPVVILVVYFVYSANELSLDDVAHAYVIGGAAVTGAWLVVTLRRIRPRTSVADIRTTLKSSYQYGLSGILNYGYSKSDIIMLSLLAGLREAGIYAAASKLVELVAKVAGLSGRVFAPAIFKASHEADKTFRILAGMMTRFLAIAGLAAGVAAFVLADELILAMFGEGYAVSVPVLRILGGVMATRCMMVALQLLLSSVDMHFQRVANLGVVVAAHIGINALLIPGFGAVGAAWASLFSSTLLILFYAVSLYGRQDLQLLRWLLVPSCLAIAVAAATTIADVHAFVAAVVALAVFLAGLLLTGFVRRDEVRFVFRSIRRNGNE